MEKQNLMLSEVKAMPEMAQRFLMDSQDFTLPAGVPYLGMGSSYFAPLAFRYLGMNIFPEMASEYYYYISQRHKEPLGVLLSQSGKSSEVLWCRELFDKYIAISNYADSPLCHSAGKIIPLLAGEEKCSSSKTYINTLLVLFKGFGIDTKQAVDVLAKNMSKYDELGRMLADEVYGVLQQGKLNGLYITGSGPNIATAMQAALILSESAKLNFHGLPMAQYDHGPKETAMNSVVMNIVSKGSSYERSAKLGATIKAAGARVFTIEEPALTEKASILANIIPFNFMACYLAQKLDIQETFVVGGKITEAV